jgi:hypothetical protein
MFVKTLFATATLAAATLAAPLEARTGSPGPTFGPSAIFNYDVGTGAIQCGPPGGLISKSTSNNGHDITTLATFVYPPESTGKNCALHFYLGPDSGLSGSQKIDVFTSLQPAPGCTTGWGPGNQRNQHLGRWQAQLNGWASWVESYGGELTYPTPCKPAGTVEAFELVGVYDNDYVSWNPAVVGVRIAMY